MSLIISKRIFYVDSHNRLSGTHSNFNYYLDYKNEDYDHCVVLQATIPKAYYLVQPSKNTFVLDENGNQVVISLPIGNYSRTSFGFQLQYQLNTNSPNGYTYVMSTIRVYTLGQFQIMVVYNRVLLLVIIYMNN